MKILDYLIYGIAIGQITFFGTSKYFEKIEFKNYQSCGLYKADGKQFIRWEDFPVKIYADQKMPEKAKQILWKAILEINENTNKNLIVFMGNSSFDEKDSKKNNVVYWKNTWEEDKSTEQARTSVIWAGKYIKSASISVNNLNFDYPAVDGEIMVGPDLKTLFIHELGHFLGLQHDDEYYNIMNTTLANNVVKNIDFKTKSKLECLSQDYKEVKYVKK